MKPGPKAKKKKLKSYTVDEIVAWASNKLKISPKQTQRDLRVSAATYYNYVKNIDTVIAEKIDVGKIRQVVFMFLPLALQSLARNLKGNNPAVTIAFFKGLGIFAEHFKGEGFGNTYNFFDQPTVERLVSGILGVNISGRSESGGTGIKKRGVLDSEDSVPGR